MRKTLDMTFPYIPNTFFWDFIRGYMDGDGTLSLKRRHLKIEIYSASNDFAQSMHEELSKRDIQVSLRTRTKGLLNPLHTLYFISKTRDDFIANLYTSGSICLERKYKIVQEYLRNKNITDSCIDCGAEFEKKHILCRNCARLRMNERSKLAKTKARALK